VRIDVGYPEPLVARRNVGDNGIKNNYGTTFFNYNILETVQPESYGSGKFIFGGGISLSTSLAIDIKSGSFFESISKAPPREYNIIPVAGASFQKREGYLGISAAAGWEAGFGSVAIEISNSYSLSDEEIEIVNEIKKENSNDVFHYKSEKKPDGSFSLELESLSNKNNTIPTGIPLTPVNNEETIFESAGYSNNKENGNGETN